MPLFLGLDEIIKIHEDQIKLYGGHPGIRDINLLASAVAMPSISFGGEYVHSSIYEMAAAYLFHVVENNPFFDGNKRVGAASAVVFLRINGLHVKVEKGKIA